MREFDSVGDSQEFVFAIEKRQLAPIARSEFDDSDAWAWFDHGGR
jgi:hypothetical protein